MFLFIDESVASKHIVHGCLCVERDALPELESKLLNRRIEDKLWGELKWTKINELYTTKYEQCLKNYFSDKRVTFHAYIYPKKHPLAKFMSELKGPGRHFRQVYPLIRSVIWKCQKHGYEGNYYIIADKIAGGKQGYAQISEYLQRDGRVNPRPEFDFCTVANSSIVGGIQIADLCSGAVSASYSKTTSSARRGVVACLESLSGKAYLAEADTGQLPTLYAKKIHVFAPGGGFA